MTLRELASKPKLLDKYSSIEIINKRKNKRRGIYLSELEAREYEEMKKEKDSKNKESFLDGINSVLGIGNGTIGDLSKEEMRTAQYAKYL